MAGDYRDPTAKRLAARERQRRRRARLKAEAERAQVLEIAPAPDDPAGELAAWAAATLKVPPGHPAAGEPMALPGFALDFLRAGWSAHESALSVARKNAKSAVCAVLALGYLAGPLRVPGWRGAIASVSKEKAAELRGQVAAIAEASGLDIRIRRAPYPGKIESATGTLEVLSSDRTAGHSSSFDLVIVDETGLMPERARELLAGLRSSVSAKGGRILHISVRGDSPLFAEVLANPATVAHQFSAPDGCTIDDESAWEAANPALGTIKQRGYMAHEVNRNLDPIRPAVFANSIAPRLGIAMPRVGTGTYATATIATSQTAEAKDKSAAIAATAGPLTVTTATPKRVSARLELTLEDIAAVGQANFESIGRPTRWSIWETFSRSRKAGPGRRTPGRRF